MSVMDAMFGGGGGAPGGPPALPPQDPSQDPQQQNSDPADLVRQALDLIRQAAQSETDDIDQANLEDIGTKLAKYLADQQKLTDGMMGTSDIHRGVRKTLAKSGGGAAGGGSY
jgi:hypothetical protein